MSENILRYFLHDSTQSYHSSIYFHYSPMRPLIFRRAPLGSTMVILINKSKTVGVAAAAAVEKDCLETTLGRRRAAVVVNKRENMVIF